MGLGVFLAKSRLVDSIWLAGGDDRRVWVAGYKPGVGSGFGSGEAVSKKG